MGDAKLTIVSTNPGHFTLSGSIDAMTSGQLRQALNDTERGNEPLILDFSNVNYISSSGLRELLIIVKKSGKDSLKLENVSPEIDEIFQTTGFSSLFNYSLLNSDVQHDIYNMSFQEMLEYKLLKSADTPFIRSHGFEYTWRDIDIGASVIAAKLSEIGVRKSTHVALCGANSVNWILTFYAIQKLGAITVLLNPQLTPEEINNISKLGDITHFCYGDMPSMTDEKEFIKMITDPEKSMIKEVFSIRGSRNFMELQLKKTFEAERTRPDDVCVMIFTSGSTGTPKGVLLSAYNMLNASSYSVNNLHMTENDKMCVILPLFHIFGLTSVLIASALSGTMLVLPDSIKPDELLRVIHDEKCTILHSVPTVMLRIVNAAGFSPELVSSLRASYLSGTPVSEAQMKLLREKFPNNHFVRRYGMSEMTPVTITDYEDSIEHILKTVGKPIKGLNVKIQNTETGEECPAGVIGEILVHGVNLMCSYYKLPIEKQPFDENGFLHTGDLAFMDEEGYIHFAGRAKELIIRGGENIMPDEVASAISACDEIADVKVMGVPDDVYGEAVAAAIVLKEGAEFNENAVREFLKNKIAKYKIPSYFFIYDRLPTLPNGKVDAVLLKKEAVEKVKTKNNK